MNLDLEQLIGHYGWFVTLGAIFVSGLLMNVTPCVYPMIPITVGYFGGMSDEGGKGRRPVIMAALFVLGMAITYSVLGVTAALSGRLFGALLGNVWVVAFVSFVLLTMGLSMLGVWQMTAPSSLLGRIQEARDRMGVLGALFFGLVVGIVMAPCVGPAIVGLLAYVAAARSPALGFVLFFTFAMGMGLPYLFLGVFAGGLKSLPRPGPWMVWVERVFGLLLVGMALWFWRPFVPEKAGVAAAAFLYAYVFVSGVYVGFLEKAGEVGVRWPRFVLFKRVVGVALMAVAAWGAVGLYAPPPTQGLVASPSASGSPVVPRKFEWQPFSAQALADAKARRVPVVIDFYATWCGACNELEKLTWSDPRVIEAAQGYVRLKMTVVDQDVLENDPAAASFRIVGLPTVVFIDAEGRERKDLRLQEFADATRMLSLFARMAPSSSPPPSPRP